MNCLQCGAPLEKSDIFCIKCETPVLTDDDIILMPNAETTKFVNEAQYKDPNPHVDDVVYTAELKHATAKFAGENSLDSLLIEKAQATAPAPSPAPSGAVINGDTRQYDRPSGGRTKKGGNRKAVTMTAVIVCFFVIGFGLFLILSSRGRNNEVPETAPPVNNISVQEDTERALPPAMPDMPAEQLAAPPDVTSIVLMVNGRAQTEFHAMVNESISLMALLEPEGSVAEVFWLSSDPDVLDVKPGGYGGFEAVIVGIAAGVADIIVTAGDVELNYVVFVDNMPSHVQLENAVANAGTPVWLTLTWLDAAATGSETLFERSDGSNVWHMENAFGRNEVHPAFGNENNAFIIELPDSTRIYYLFADGTGHLSNPDGSDKEDFLWFFMTTLIEPEG